MGANELSALLWRERELLELLTFKLEEEQLLLTAGRTRWIEHATREVEQVLVEAGDPAAPGDLRVDGGASADGCFLQDAAAVEKARGKPKGPTFFGRLFGDKARPEPPPTPPLILEAGEGALVDLDKAWHGVHYLLTGTAWEGEPPLNFVVEGGADLDYDGPWNSSPRIFTPA